MPWVLEGGAIVEATIVGELFGQRTLSVFHYKYDSQVNISNGQAYLDVLAGILNDAGGLVDCYAQACSLDLGLESLVLQKVHPAPRIRRYVYAPALEIGQQAGAAMTPNVAVAVTKTADQATRHGIGTLHVPGVPVGNVAGGELTQFGQEAFDNLLASIKEVLDGGTWVPVIYNKANPAASLLITQTQLQTTVRTMRRRTVGLGI